MNVLRGLKKKTPIFEGQKNASYPIFGFKSKKKLYNHKKITRTQGTSGALIKEFNIYFKNNGFKRKLNKTTQKIWSYLAKND